MLLVISPAKTLDYESRLPINDFTQPDMLDDSQQLVATLRQLAPQDIASLMHVSDKIALLNFDRFNTWSRPFTPGNARQALLAFKGDVYEGLEAGDFDAGDFDFAQTHLRMLSGLYGVLRPLDLMQAYRLEMGTQLATGRGKSLYAFWGDRITEKLNAELATMPAPLLVNLASNEYFKSVNTRKLQARIITPHFKDWKNGEYKIISFYAKRARGMMSRFVIKNRLVDPEQLKQFNSEGYAFNVAMSDTDNWVFTRKPD